MRKLKKILTYTLMAIVAVVTLAAGGAWAAQATPQQTEQQKEMAQFLRGARLWGAYCDQCHKARPPAEFSPADWDTVLMHMRSRANLTADNADDVLVFLKRR